MAVVICLTLISVSAQTATQTQPVPAGGKTSDSAAAKVNPKPATTSTKTRKPTRTSTAAAPGSTIKAAPVMDSMAGKWWTTNNAFGTSQVFFEQEGSTVRGAIMYADGRTATLTGKLAGRRLNYTWTNSTGDSGTGWLDQSWNNVLGGSYRTQRGVTVPWTLNRIAGNWCFGGSPNRVRKVTHSMRGQLFFLTEVSGEEAGHLEGPWIFLHGEFGDVKGTMNYKGDRVDFATGTYWTWCGK